MLVDRIFDEKFETPVTVYAREETLRAVQEHLFNDVIWPDFAQLPTAENPMLRYQVCSPGDTSQSVIATFMRLMSCTAFRRSGIRCRIPAASFAVSGDTKTNETLWPVLNACDDLKVLVIEVSFPDEMEPGCRTRVITRRRR